MTVALPIPGIPVPRPFALLTFMAWLAGTALGGTRAMQAARVEERDAMKIQVDTTGQRVVF
jgi:hypothetical protein